MKFSLHDFVAESNRIEGIHRPPSSIEMAAMLNFLKLPTVTLSGLMDPQVAFAPGKPLRDRPGMNVRVGNHLPPEGGLKIRELLVELLDSISNKRLSAYAAHHEYETLHPFMDGNGRTGRALWLWQMGGIERAPLGFLHHWYYQSLSNQR